MPIAQTLTPLLLGAAKLLASSAAGEFAKGAGKTAYEAIKTRLTGEHSIASATLLDHAPQKPDYESLITTDLSNAALDRNEALLARELNNAIRALPDTTPQTGRTGGQPRHQYSALRRWRFRHGDLYRCHHRRDGRVRQQRTCSC